MAKCFLQSYLRQEMPLACMQSIRCLIFMRIQLEIGMPRVQYTIQWIDKKGKFPAELIHKTQWESKLFCKGPRGVLRPIKARYKCYNFYTNRLPSDRYLLAAPLLSGRHTDITSKGLLTKYFILLREECYYVSQIQCIFDREHRLTYDCIAGFRH